MPDVPIETPSETEIVLNSIGVAARFADARLHVDGEVALVEVARHRLDPVRRDADDGLCQVLVGEARPPLSIARAPARSGPSVSAALWRLAGSESREYGFVVTAHALLLVRRTGSGRRRRGSGLRAPARTREPTPGAPTRSRWGRSPRASSRAQSAGGSSRTAARSGAPAARYGSCRRSASASANRSEEPVASAAPSSAARAEVNAASPCATSLGERGARRRGRDGGLGDERDGNGRRVVGESRDPRVPREAHAPGERGGQVVGVALEPDSLGEQLLRAQRRAPPPRLRRRARAR